MRVRPPTLALFSVLSVAVVATSQAARQYDRPLSEPIAGAAHVVDGDSLKIDGTSIRIHGIDAPEAAQSCNAAPDRQGGAQPGPPTWACGREATRAMARLVHHQPVSCHPTTLDKYGRVVARCFAGDLDLGAEMVRAGLAWAFVRYSADYVEIEKEARMARRGIWQADTQTAWDFRADKWQAATETAPEGCTIKGNVSWKGERIYHVPWSSWYTNVRMDAASMQRKGKRWFCSEAEAIAAGWRPSMTQ